MATSLALNYTADTSALVAQSAVAKAEVRSLTSEMNALAKAAAAGMGPEVGPALQAVASELVHARGEAAHLSAEMREMQSAGAGVGETLEELHEKVAGAFEFAGVATAIEAVHMLGEAIESLGERAIEIRTSSDVIGVTGEQFQAMQIAAEEAGVGMDIVTRAAEKLNVTLFEARQGSAAATEKLFSLGATTAQIHDPTFKLNDLLQGLHDRLIDTSTAEQTMNELTKELGSRAALAAEALKKYDGSAESVKEVMGEINGLMDEDTKKLAETLAYWGEVGKAAVDTTSKIFIAVTNMLPHTTGGIDPILREMETGAAEIKEAAIEQQDINRETGEQEMNNAKAGIAAFKEGTQERLEQLRIYAEAARQYYGSDTIDVVVKANNEIIGQQRAVTEHAEAELKKQKAQQDELYSGWATTYTEINNRHREMIEKETADAEKQVKAELQAQEKLIAAKQSYVNNLLAADDNYLREAEASYNKDAKDQVSAWKGVVGEIEGAESSLVGDILGKRKGLAQSLIQLSGQVITKEISDDLKAVTTRMLFHDTAANAQKALEQGGLLYHLAVNAQTTAATARAQAAQTSAVTTGNIARTASTDAAAAASSATSSAVGSKTVLQDAAKAFSGTYASVAQIPYVGWILAPIAASAAYAGVAAYEGLASLDTGTNYVPRDMIAQIHEGEQVVPRAYNPDANPGLTSAAGTGYSEEHNYHGDVNVSAFDAVSVSRLLSRPEYRNAVVTAAAKSIRRGAR